MHLPIALVLVSVLTFSPAISAQSHSVLPRTTILPASTRAMALGDSYVLNSVKADMLFYHPALLARATGFGGSLQRWGSASSAASMSGAFEFLGGTLGIGLRTLQYGTESEDELHAPLGQDHHFRPGGERSYERTASIGYGRELWGALSLGLAIDLLEIRLESLQQNIMLIDFGISADLGPIGVGLTAHDIGNKPFHDVPDEPFEDFGSRPSRIVLGAGTYGQEVGIFDVGFAANAGVDRQDSLTYGAGAEIGYYPVRGRTFVLRIGLQHVPQKSEMSPFTTGFAFWLDDFTIEWAFRPVNSAPERGSHRFGISWR
ncbi:MAG: hypothetical protein CME27_07130 [Gemmatimonadetes bacterium]|nr:hypothetical protein [Gemmatimonadota bacterium]